MNKLVLLTLCALFFNTFQACHPVFAAGVGGAEWKIVKTSWSVTDEKNFQSFIARLGDAVEKHQCHTVAQCLTSSANTYHNSDPAGLRYYSDCADLPYYLRAYFSWKNGLPFSYASSMRQRSVPGNQGDIRYSAYGNEVAQRVDIVSRGGSFPNALNLLNSTIEDQTDSGNFRINYAGNDTGSLFADFYPVKLDRESLTVGTVLYDPNGHVTTIYKVTDDGKLYYIDAHPDNSMTNGVFSVKFVRSNPGQGAGFKNWRPIKLVGATQNAQGYWMGGKVVGVPNSELPAYGAEQFFGNQGKPSDWTQSKFIYQGKSITYYDYIRNKMAKGDLRIQPVDDFRATLADLCESVRDRGLAVDVAIKAGVDRRDHPERLPINIYGSQGDWETFSTPSRDAQLKVSFRDLIDQADNYMKKLKAGDPTIVYSGNNIAQDLLDVYQKESVRCQFTYTNSVGSGVTLNLEDIRSRLFKLSFDPYNCVELRWGATDRELGTCQDTNEKRLWYTREQRLRNQHVRRYDIRMDFSLEDLLQPTPNNGIATPIDIDIVRFLQNAK